MELVGLLFEQVCLWVYKCIFYIERGGIKVIDALGSLLERKFDQNKVQSVAEKVLWGFAIFELIWFVHHCLVVRDFKSVLSDIVSCSIYGSIYGGVQSILSSVGYGEAGSLPVWIFSGISVVMMTWLGHILEEADIPKWGISIHLLLFNIWFGAVCGKIAPSLFGFLTGARKSNVLLFGLLCVLLAVSFLGAFKNLLETATDLFMFGFILLIFIFVVSVVSRFVGGPAANILNVVLGSDRFFLILVFAIGLIINILKRTDSNPDMPVDELPVMTYLSNIPIIGKHADLGEMFVIFYIVFIMIMMTKGFFDAFF